MNELIVFAHKKEAQAFIHELCLENVDPNFPLFFSNNNTGVLIIGQGLIAAKTNLGLFFEQCRDNIKKILNFGIAGRLNKSLIIDEIYAVNWVNLFNGDGCREGFALGNLPHSMRCVSSHVPISNKNFDNSIISCGDFVDMELWAVARFASENNIRAYASKLISDDAMQPLDINKIKSKSARYSEKLFAYYQSAGFSINKE